MPSYGINDTIKSKQQTNAIATNYTKLTWSSLPFNITRQWIPTITITTSKIQW